MKFENFLYTFIFHMKFEMGNNVYTDVNSVWFLYQNQIIFISKINILGSI